MRILSQPVLALIIAGIIGTSSADQNQQAPAEAVVESLAENTDDREGILFWSPRQRRIGFKHIEDIFPTRTVEAGTVPTALQAQPMDVSDVSYTVDGQPFSLTSFVERDQNVALIIIKDGKVLFEHYADGNTPDDVWVSFSVTKSITSLLIGAAIQDGYIESVDEPVIHYLPRLRGSGYEKATIRDVLQMSSGIDWNEDYSDPASDVARAGGANGLALVQYLSDLPSRAEPGEQFNYNTGETNLVGQILRSAIGNNASTYLEHKIWKPFGMANDANWILGSEGGAELGGCCLSMTLRDYARIGLFALNDGVLPDGTRVLPTDWMDASTSPAATNDGYGYLWWLYGDGSYAALGIFGQTIFVDPKSRSVIAIHSSAASASGSPYHEHRNALVSALRDHLRAMD